jgi:hypothetical protein
VIVTGDEVIKSEEVAQLGSSLGLNMAEALTVKVPSALGEMVYVGLVAPEIGLPLASSH